MKLLCQVFFCEEVLGETKDIRNLKSFCFNDFEWDN